MQTKRRSIYALGKNINSLQPDIIKTIKNCVKHCPSPFNVQSARVVVLLGKYQQEFWNMTFGAIENVAPPEKISAAKSKIDSFAAAYGTILFFEDKHSLDELKKQFPPYAKNMSVWAQQANGMLQYMIWDALAQQNVGASLQHYNELIEEEISAWLNLPKYWEMVAQMPFGSIEKKADEKSFLPLENRVIVLEK